MRRFLLTLTVFLGVQVLVFVVLLAILRRAPDPYLVVLQRKHANLDELRQPRLIMVGGSNLAFGIHSEMLARALPYRPVNLGLHGALGLEFMLEDALLDVRRDDLVMLSLEYGIVAKEKPARELWEGILVRPGVLRGFDRTYLADFGLDFIAHVTNRARNVLLGQSRTANAGIFRWQSFNEYGDMVAHRSLHPIRPWTDGDPRITRFDASNEGWMPRLRQFVRTCEERGAHVVIVFPPIPEALFAGNKEWLRRYVDEQRVLFGERVVSTLDDIPLPEQEFFDSSYHLTNAASVRRTDQIIARLHSAARANTSD